MKFWLAVAFAEPGDLVDLARAADESGWEGVTVSDHLVYPRELRSRYPYTPDGSPGWQPSTSWPDPWVTIGARAAATRRLRFTTNVYVAPARDLFTVAKAVSTAAVLSGERVAVGLAPGWCEEEFQLTGQDFATRGKRLEEMVAALRALLAGGWTSFDGEHVRFPELQISPVPDQPVPVYFGGDTPVALRRASRIGDGWIGTLFSPDDAIAKAAELRGLLEAAGRSDSPFEIMLSVLARDDRSLFARLEDAGVTGIIHAPWILAQADDPASLRQARLDAVRRFGEEYIAGQ
jgi:probable F420-dependent oxidoreductase